METMQTGLVGIGSGLSLLHCAESGLDPLSELLTGHALYPFNHFLDAAIGPNAETDGLLSHPGPEKEPEDASCVSWKLGQAGLDKG